MAITCPKCGAQYDVTLFEFGRTVKCDCGQIIDASKPQIRIVPAEGSKDPDSDK
jgi:predicted Zn finger-like uncharacterized protein